MCCKNVNELGNMAGHGNFTSTRPFTEDLKICECTGVGFQPNQLYQRDGQRTNEHDPEDKSFHYKPDENIALYGVFDGMNGCDAAVYVMQEMPGQILLGQLSDNSTEVEIRDVLKQAFLSVERGYFQTVVDPLLVQRVRMLSEVSEAGDGTTYYAQATDHPRLDISEKGITSSASALVVLMFNGKLYIANAGDCRAQVCVTDPSTGVKEVIELNSTHDLRNEDELQRLRSLNLDLDALGGKIGNQEITRCIGNYLVKGGYKEDSVLNHATSEPVIAEPEITSYPMTDTTHFLILLSSGLYKALEEVTEHVNSFLAETIMEEFSMQTSMNGVVQAVIDKVARMHQEVPRVCRREDMTLLVRNFNYPLRSQSRSSPLTDRYRYPSSSLTPFTPTFTGTYGIHLEEDQFYDPDTVSIDTASSDSLPPTKVKFPEKIKPYVDFTSYYKALETNPDLSEQYFFNE